MSTTALYTSTLLCNRVCSPIGRLLSAHSQFQAGACTLHKISQPFSRLLLLEPRTRRRVTKSGKAHVFGLRPSDVHGPVSD